MLLRSVRMEFVVALSLIAVTLSPISVFGQSASTPDDLRTEVTTLKTENAAVRERLRTMEEQQRALIEQVTRLQRRLEGGAPSEAAAQQPAASPAMAQPA